MGLAGRPFALLHPGGGGNPGMTLVVKRWPLPQFAALARRLAAQSGLAVLAIGGPGDTDLTAALAEQAGPGTWDAGGAEWLELAALAERAALYVGNDTGATHVAAAVGCQTVMVLGPSDPRRYAPFAPPGQAVAVWREWARHLMAGHHTADLRGGAAGFDWDQHGVGVEEVWQACAQLLISAGKPAPTPTS
mgnify:FL=1